MASASQLTNPLGAQVFQDGTIPRTFTGKAIETISGGFLVTISGANGDVGSAVNSIVTEDFNLIGAQDRTLCNGIALNNAASGGLVTVATRGGYLGYAASVITAGAELGHNASGCFVAKTQAADSGTAAVDYTTIGRAQSTSASGTANFVLAYLNV